MFKRAAIALTLALTSMTLIACDKDDKHHFAVTPEQKQEQAQKNIQEMNVLAEELEREGFRVYPLVETDIVDLNVATDLVGKVIVEASGSEKLTRVQGKLEKFISLAKETVDFSGSDDVKINADDVKKVQEGLKNAQAFNDAINKEVGQERAEAKEEDRTPEL